MEREIIIATQLKEITRYGENSAKQLLFLVFLFSVPKKNVGIAMKNGIKKLSKDIFSVHYDMRKNDNNHTQLLIKDR